jgi:peptidoglycan/xylan/chitin deacetylase (PgdA/CDA1 family)
MAKTIRNGMVYLNGTALRWGRRRFGKRIIVFHEIKDLSKFRGRIEWLKEHYDLVSLEDLFTVRVSDKTRIAITFDDGYASWYDQAAPVLEELKIPAVFFVCSGFVDSKGKDGERFCRENFRRSQKLSPLTKKQLIDLANNPLFEAGSHSMNHIDLGKVIARKTLEREINGDRRQIEDWTGKKVQWFAYPFGGRSNVSPEAIQCLRQSSFRAAFTLIPCFFDFHKEKLMIGRDSLDVTESTWLWRAWLNGGYDSLYCLKEAMRARWRSQKD